MVYNLKVTMLVAVLSLLCGSVYSINNSIAIAQPTYSVIVSKTSISDFTVTNGGSYTGSFDTTYTMRGSEIEFEATRDLLISSIVSDFDKSPTIGYIKIHNNDTQLSGNKTGLPNPFAGQDQINKKISSVLSNALDNIIHPAPGITLASGPNFRQIKCEFGDVLSDFRCDVTPVLLK